MSLELDDLTILFAFESSSCLTLTYFCLLREGTYTSRLLAPTPFTWRMLPHLNKSGFGRLTQGLPGGDTDVFLLDVILSFFVIFELHTLKFWTRFHPGFSRLGPASTRNFCAKMGFDFKVESELIGLESQIWLA